MAAPRCGLCSSQDASYICECSSPPILICRDCFLPEHSSHTYYQLEVNQAFQPRASGEVNIVSNVYCAICSNPALFICICLRPLQGFCEADFPQHKAKFPQANHYPIPVSHLSNIPTTSNQDFAAFRDRQILIDQTLDRVRNSRTELHKKQTQTERVLQDLLLQLDIVREEKMGEIDRQIGDIETKIMKFEQNSEQMRYNPDFAPQTQLEHFVLRQRPAELTSQRLDFLKVTYPGLPDAKRAIDHLISIRANLQLFDQPPMAVPLEINREMTGTAIFPYVTSMNLILFQLPCCLETSKRPFERNNRPFLDAYSQIVVLSNGYIFCVGGKDSNSAYTINPHNCQVQKDPNMSKKRGNAGLIFLFPYIYVFGGMHDCEDLSHCERFNSENKVWVSMQTSMKEKRSRFCPCSDGNKVYLLGGGAELGEYYSIQHDSFYTLRFEMPSRGPTISFRANNGSIVCISGNDMYIMVDSRLESLHKPCTFEPCSHIAPITIGEKLYFTDATNGVKVIAVNLRDFRWEELAHHSPASL